MTQTWERLLFLHWRFPADEIQARLPPGLMVDTFDGEAWIGVVPFLMRNIRIRGVPPIPGTVNFLELNCRTYVRDRQGMPGVWFFSLDASSWLAVRGARQWYRLPYWWARMSAGVDESAGRVDYRSHRHGAAEDTASRFIYEPAGESRLARPGSLEFFLVERYVLFAEVRPGRLSRGRVHHPPYQIAEANVELCDDRLLALNRFDSAARPPDHALVSRRVDVDVFRLQPLAGT
jgi:uncharacterized protein YqjF (DUF2071 family)